MINLSGHAHSAEQSHHAKGLIFAFSQRGFRGNPSVSFSSSSCVLKEEMVFLGIVFQVREITVWSVPAEGGLYFCYSLSPHIVRDDLKSWETPISLSLSVV